MYNIFCFTCSVCSVYLVFFFFNDTATTEIYTLSLHDALPISWVCTAVYARPHTICEQPTRSEEHTSELQSRRDLVCRLLLEKKNKKRNRRKETTKKNKKKKSQTKNQ